ncbi:hypothetical protein EXE58_18825 [Nocardioides seonyuensis]|uniref:Uncharacterized protein n=1 Tax=Nocardioides seonyuensis TaxID=2518371 RepID=A0A4P7IL87_9ACTN|nr:hypothetical protein [Nocardioides seonyuensis]QBX57277.1 hypothetical protein EXE58_18825 [Nocardioides seonyuensis]
MRTAATGLRWARATTVATAATVVALAAHLGADGSAPSSPVLAFLVLALTAALAPFLARPASSTRIVLLTVVGQFVAHATLTLAAAQESGASSPTHVMSGGALGGAHHAHASTTAGSSVVTQLSELVFAADARMLLAHTAAAVVVGVWLAAGDRAVWTLASLIWRALVLPLLPLPASPAPVRATASGALGMLLPRIEVGSVVRRGPPHLLPV